MPEGTAGIGIIVLAAGYSRRFDGDKRQEPMGNGLTLLQTTLSAIPDSFSRRVLVLHPGDEALGTEYAERWRLCFAENAGLGMGHSLAAAMEFTSGWTGAVIALGDMPYVQPETYHAVQTALLRYPLVRPCCQGRVGNPAGLQAEFFPDIKKLRGDEGARVLFHEHEEIVHHLPCRDWGIIRDVDTRAALAEKRQEGEKS